MEDISMLNEALEQELRQEVTYSINANQEHQFASDTALIVPAKQPADVDTDGIIVQVNIGARHFDLLKLLG
jgi:hypothetical protein